MAKNKCLKHKRPVGSRRIRRIKHILSDASKYRWSVPPGDVSDLERDRTGRHGRIMKYNLNAG